jgi:hypothetical protein
MSKTVLMLTLLEVAALLGVVVWRWMRRDLR